MAESIIPPMTFRPLLLVVFITLWFGQENWPEDKMDEIQWRISGRHPSQCIQMKYRQGYQPERSAQRYEWAAVCVCTCDKVFLYQSSIQATDKEQINEKWNPLWRIYISPEVPLFRLSHSYWYWYWREHKLEALFNVLCVYSLVSGCCPAKKKSHSKLS